MAVPDAESAPTRLTRILPVDKIKPPRADAETDLASWFLARRESFPLQSANLAEAAAALRESAVPVAFPTETVYGLAADATRSEAVRGIYEAKQRPLDNPLIVHFGSLPQLRRLLRPPKDYPHCQPTNGFHFDEFRTDDPIPPVYALLISRFWPGPLTILLPTPAHSPLSPLISPSLPTFGARIPSSPLARLLISLANRPIAAPSANASGRPSPTTAQHVLDDLDGRIEIILDGGPCEVGVESTVVDGLSDPPAVLRPGGVGIEEIRALGGRWAGIKCAYEDRKETVAHLRQETAPRAPGMKYRHYAPRGRVLLVEAGTNEPKVEDVLRENVPMSDGREVTVGIVRTRAWREFIDLDVDDVLKYADATMSRARWHPEPHRECLLLDVFIGPDVPRIAKGLFSALRTLDEANCHVILVEGIPDQEGDLAAAVMNRLRKAADG